MKNWFRLVFASVFILFASVAIVEFQKPLTRSPYAIQFVEYPNLITGTQGFPIVTEEYVCEVDDCHSIREKYLVADYIKLEYLNIGFYFIVLGFIMLIFRKKLFR